MMFRRNKSMNINSKGGEGGEHTNESKGHFKLIILVLFVLVVVLILIGSFFDGFSVTGNSVRTLRKGDSLRFSANLNMPSVEIGGVFEEIIVVPIREEVVYVDGREVSLATGGGGEIVLEDAKLGFSFERGELDGFSAKAKSVKVGDVLIRSKERDIDVLLDDGYSLFMMKIEEGVFLDELVYSASGTVSVGGSKNVLRLDEEELTLEDYQGSLRVENDSFILDGYLMKLKVDGEQKVVFEK